MYRKDAPLSLTSKKNYPKHICNNCGSRWGNNRYVNETADWIEGKCDLCGQTRSLTGPAEFGELKVEYDGEKE